MAFICPKCGFKDSPCWRGSHWFLYVVTCKIDELEQSELDIAKRLMTARDWKGHAELEWGPYTYFLTKSGRVYRVPTELKGEYKRGHWQEKPKDKRQRGLLEASQ